MSAGAAREPHIEFIGVLQISEFTQAFGKHLRNIREASALFRIEVLLL